MRSLFLLALVSIAGCSNAAEAPQQASTSGQEASATVCEPGRDQTCNDDPAISSLHGACKPDGTCECAEGVEKNPATGRCL